MDVAFSLPPEQAVCDLFHLSSWSTPNLDPVVIRHKASGGLVGIVIQVADDAQPRPGVLTEFFNNWVPTVAGTTPVEPAGKTATTWAALKTF
jgi:hypothetical protein